MSTPAKPRQWGSTLPQRDKHMPRSRAALTLVRDIDSGQPRKPRKHTGFSRPVKMAVRVRAGNGDIEQACCEACGIWLGRYGGEIQHRKARGMGGTSLGLIDSIVNAVLLCGSGAMRTGCHGLCEDRDKDGQDMNERGFWLKSGQDPVTESIRHGSRGKVYLLLNGTYGSPEPDGGSVA